jgi:hypothetical protein
MSKRNQPLSRRWREAEIPGGAPQSSGWQTIAIAVEDSKAEIYYWMKRSYPAALSLGLVLFGFTGV